MWLIRLFPLWALALSAVAYVRPAEFAALKPAIVPLLSLIMFGMGMTLRAADFRTALRRPGIIALGMLLQYTVMPLAAVAVARLLGLDPALLVGMVLVGASAGGTASNVICYLARGDVALSIVLTLCSTLLAVAATPGLTWLLVGQLVPVPVWSMLKSVLEIIVLPVVAGVAIKAWLGTRFKRIEHLFPRVSVLAIMVIIAIIVALNQQRLATLALPVVAAVALHNLAGLAAGYGAARLLGLDPAIRRTLAIEVGMQNSGLSVALALKYFGTAAALPGAVFSIWHNLSGSVLAAWWGRRR